jgi:hypothetical protein
MAQNPDLFCASTDELGDCACWRCIELLDLWVLRTTSERMARLCAELEKELENADED